MKTILRAAIVPALLGALLPATGAGAAGTRSPGEPLAGASIANTASLNFGRLSASAIAGNVTMSPLGVRLATGGVTLLNQGAPGAASFAVTGSPLAVYSIVLPANGTVSLTSGGSPPLALNLFLSLPALVGTLSLSGTQTLLVGGTLAVGANQPGGTYSGTFNVTVAFN